LRFDFSNSPDKSPHSRGAMRPSCACIFRPETEGVGNAGCPLHPQPRARSVESTRVSHHEFTGTPGIPARDGVNGFLRALPGDRALLPPSPPRNLLLENLTPASGRQDHTASPSARVRSRQQRRSRPSHPNPTFVTIAKRPSVWAGMGKDVEVICVKSEPKYFCKGGLDR
jgi:hypothetical protein